MFEAILTAIGIVALFFATMTLIYATLKHTLVLILIRSGDKIDLEEYNGMMLLIGILAPVCYLSIRAWELFPWQ